MFRYLASLFTPIAKARTRLDDLGSTEQQQATHLLASETIDAAELVRLYPPQISHAKKQTLFDIALSRGQHGTLTCRRYSEIPLPSYYQPFDPETKITGKRGYFKYSTPVTSDHWFMNFAHHDLFHGYGHFMFAQDEVQVVEHPALASAREMMLSRTDKLRPLTVEHQSPTPILFRGVPRMLQINTRAIYGARLAHADEATIRQSTIEVDPPTHSNILAMEAPIYSGNRIYTRAEIEAALRTAFTGFRAVVLSSLADYSPPQSIVVHTGNWGCGAYGGNRQLMLSVQMIAARLAGLTEAVFYCGNDSVDEVQEFELALRQRFQVRPGVGINTIVERLVGADFHWGTPDGN